MATYNLRKGRDINLKGKAAKEFVKLPLPKQIAIQPTDFRGLKPRLLVKIGDVVKVGTPLIVDKKHPEIKFVSSASGKVCAINRGEKRLLLEVVIETDGKQDAEKFETVGEQKLKTLTKKKVTELMLNSGLWPIIRQRPFSKVANPEDNPKSIFVRALNTDPLGSDVDFILQGKEKDFQLGVEALTHLTEGKVFVCTKKDTQIKFSATTKNIETHQFSGPHPTGNVSTHIHLLDPINKGDIVWYVEAQDVVRLGRFFTNGEYPAERVVAITGDIVKNRVYAQTIIGTPVSALLQGTALQNTRCISGSILSGKNVGKNGFLGFYDAQVTVIPEGGRREFLGWLVPGFGKYTFSHTYASAFLPEKEVSLDTDENGGHRAIVLNHLYDEYVSLDIVTYFLLKAIIAGDIEEAEKLGILECDEEDFSLCTFACPSKVDVGAIIRKGLDLIEKES